MRKLWWYNSIAYLFYVLHDFMLLIIGNDTFLALDNGIQLVMERSMYLWFWAAKPSLDGYEQAPLQKEKETAFRLWARIFFTILSNSIMLSSSLSYKNLSFFSIVELNLYPMCTPLAL